MDAKRNQEQFFQLLRLSMGVTEQKDFVATDEDWQWLHEEADRQSLTGVIYGAMIQLPANQQPPVDLLIQWMCEADVINGKNEQLNQESARLTKLFGNAGRRTAILKGQANARLYPDKFSRQTGDIDIWVEGGQESVINLLISMGLLDEISKTVNTRKHDKPNLSYHHVHLTANEKKVSIEVHFRPSSGNYNPYTNKRLQLWLNAEIMNTEVVEEGFNVPSVRFALMMQLAHIQRHLLTEGIGLRQIIDYYWLMRNSTEADRWQIATHLKGFGLRETAGALMWVLGEVLQMDRALMLCEPDSYRGEWLLREIIEGGNFGHHSKRVKTDSDIVFFLRKIRHQKEMFPFAPSEMFWYEVDYIKGLFMRLPERIRQGRLSLR